MPQSRLLPRLCNADARQAQRNQYLRNGAERGAHVEADHICAAQPAE